jgi:dihydrofolate reductase
VRKLIVCNNMSLDGYYEGPDKNVMALPMEEAFDAYYLELMNAADILLAGTTSYEGFMGFWPALADMPDATEAQQGVGAHWRNLHKVVVSDSLTPDQAAPGGETTIVRRADAERTVAELKQQAGRDILTFGSRTTWSRLLQAGLVDELHLLVGGGVVGGGTPMFDSPLSGLRLLADRRVGDNAILLRYDVSGGE